MTSFVVVPQWQGSASSRAMRLVDGAHTLGADLPASRTHAVTVPLEAGDGVGSGVLRCSSLMAVRDRQRVAIRDADDGSPVITIGGDCGVELASVEHSLLQHPDVAVIWLDAHPDLNTPESSPSGAFGGMVLRTLLGEGAPQLIPEHALSPSRVVLAGTRDFDDDEQRYVTEAGIPVIAPGDVGADALIAAVEATGATSVYLHIDLDVLDPGELAGLTSPLPFGVSTSVLLETVRGVRSRFSVVGAGVAAFAPASPEAAADDMPTLLRLIGALTR
ncbi:MAG: arginase family protein [Microbacteriaceae bacterium]